MHVSRARERATLGSVREAGSQVEKSNAVVTKVVDGDTIRVLIQGRTERVRFIGMDTPETHGRGGLKECFGEEATLRTQQLIPPGTAVRLIGDSEPRDKYGRLLAYVYRASDNMFVNRLLVAEGYAVKFPYPPNTANAEEFARLSDAAKSAGTGLWGKCGGPDTRIN